KYGIWIYFAAVIASFLMPILYQKEMRLVPINFLHLVKRIALLVIISFGEVIVGVASIFLLLMVVFLFLIYFTEFNHTLDSSLNTLGFRLIYSHY
ncbi:low temperature requirement protein A, partial [Streptococcus danieliae]|nr:low temperature requirement protein A [Streptococcus danieliae]